MKPGVIYRGSYVNMAADPVTNAGDQQTIIISLSDTETLIDDNDTAEVRDLELAENPLRRRVVDSDEDKHKPVKAKEVEIIVYSSSEVKLSTFAVGGEKRWKVEVDVNELGKNIFTGFLSPNDISVDFMPDPNEITLVATCGLGSLKDVPLTDFEGDTPLNEHRVIDFLTWALSKTGLSLELMAIMNLRHGTGSYTAEVDFASNLVNLPADTSFFYPGQNVRISGTASNNGDFTVRGDLSFINVDIITFEETFVNESNVTATFQDISSEVHFYQDQWLNAKTFEGQEIGECEDCYSVLEKVLGEDCFVTQWKGKWYVLRIDEMDENNYYRALFDTTGEFVEFYPVINFTKEIGLGEEMSWMNDDAVVSLERPFAAVTISYMFEYWRELIPNSEFIRGDVIDDSDPLEKTYEIEGWSIYKDLPNTTPVDNTAFIRRTFDEFGNELSRFAVIDIGGTDVAYYIESIKVPVGAKDKLRFSVDVKWNGQVETTAGFFRRNIAQIRLYADDGTYYTLDGGNNSDTNTEWKLNNSTWSSNNGYFYLELDGGDDDTEWRTTSFYDAEISPEIPKAGFITILLHHVTKPDEFEVHFSNLRVEHVAYINGSHSRYTGFHNKVSVDTSKSVREKEVYINQGVSKLHKGALQRLYKYEDYFTGTITFASPNAFSISGYRVNDFPKGKRLEIDSSTINGFCRVVSSTYNLIGDTTAVTVDGISISTVTESGTIKDARYILSHSFFAANVLPSGPTSLDQVHTFGYIQAFSVWNQYNRYMRKFEGSLDHIPLDNLDSVGNVDIPDLLHKYYIRDVSEDTTNGSDMLKYFMKLHFDQDIDMCESEVFLHEVYDTAEPKDYDSDFEYKFLTGKK